MKQSLLVGQSGGPTVVINSSLAGVIRTALESDTIDTIYGMINGVEGLFDENFINLTETFKNNAHGLNLLKLTPAMYLGSCRFKLSKTKEEFEKIVSILQKHNIGYFIYIGGNDSMDTVKKLSDYVADQGLSIRVVGVPKTIDNDLVGIDHSPGFGSAAKFVATAVKNIFYDTSIYSIKSVHIIETMGRNAGWLTAASVLARNGNSITAPHLIYLPEVAFDEKRFLEDVRRKLKEYNTVVVVVSEGIRNSEGHFIAKASAKSDGFNHVALGGVAYVLKELVEREIGCKVRALELSILQRCFGNLTSATDVNEAYNLGVVATRAALNQESGVFATLHRNGNLPYEVSYSVADVAMIANAERCVPREWISEQGNDVTAEMVEYLKPLTEGAAQILFENGLPDYIDIRHLDFKQQKYKN